MYGILHFIGSSIRNRPLKAQRLINFRSLRSSTIFTNSFPSRDLFGQCNEMTNKHFIYGNYYILDNRTADQEAESRLKISSAVQCSDSAVSCLIGRTVWFLHHLFTDHHLSMKSYFFYTILSLSIYFNKGVDLSAKNSVVWGPGLDGKVTLPARFFFIQSVDKGSNK